MWKSAASKKEAITKVYEDIKEREKDEGGKINRGVRLILKMSLETLNGYETRRLEIIRALKRRNSSNPSRVRNRRPKSRKIMELRT